MKTPGTGNRYQLAPILFPRQGETIDNRAVTNDK